MRSGPRRTKPTPSRLIATRAARFMARVLVIEDEALLRDGVCRGIAKAGYAVDEADSLDEALHRIDAQAPDIIISDIDLPGRSGLELIGELGRRGLRTPVIFVSGYLNAYRAQIPHHAGVQVMEKPVSIETLREAVRRTVSGSRANIELTPFTLIDFLQLACLGRHSVRLIVQRDGEPLGVVVVESGQLWSAKDASGSGEVAFGRLAFAEGAQTRVERLEGDTGLRNITSPWEFVVMEAARARDETARGVTGTSPRENDDASFPSEPPSIRLGEWDPVKTREAEAPAPPTPEPPTADPAVLAFNEAFERGIDALLRKQHQRALEAFLDAAGHFPNDPKVVSNIKRLKEMGYDLASDSEAPSAAPKPEGRS